MAILTLQTKLGNIEIRGIVGRPNELGATWCGWSEIGEYFPEAGIYQKRPSRKGQFFVRMKHFISANPQTPTQQAGRNKFALAVSAWQAMTEEEKKVYRKRHSPPHMTGYNRFLRDYMRDLA